MLKKPYNRFTDPDVYVDLSRCSKAERADFELRTKAWEMAIENGDFSLGEKLGIFLPETEN